MPAPSIPIVPDDPDIETGAIGALRRRMTEPEPMTWSFIGDSVTAAGWHTFGHRGYVELFNERVRELWRRTDIVINAGHSGWQVEDLLDDLDRIAVRFTPNVVVIGIGINDTKKGPDGTPVFMDGYRHVVQQLRDAGVDHIISQTPNRSLPTAPDHVVDHLESYVTATRELSAELGTILVDHHGAWQDAEDGSWFHWLGHGCHPNAAGHRALHRQLCTTLGIWNPEDSRTCRLSIP